MLILIFILNAEALVYNQTSTVNAISSFLTRLDSIESDRFLKNSPNLRQTPVGQNCGATNIYVTTAVTLYPYPITAGALIQLVQYGYFLQDIYVQENVFGTCYNNMLWNYLPIDIGQDVQSYIYYSLTTDLIFPTDPGSYLVNMQLVAGVHISCWEFSFNI